MKKTFRKIVWRVEQDGDHRLILTNNSNASYYEYSVCSAEEFLLNRVTLLVRDFDRRSFDAKYAKPFTVWRLAARAKNGNLLSMCEYTTGPDAGKLRKSMLEEAVHLAGYLIRFGISEAQDGPHIDAVLERHPGAKLDFGPKR